MAAGVWVRVTEQTRYAREFNFEELAEAADLPVAEVAALEDDELIEIVLASQGLSDRLYRHGDVVDSWHTLERDDSSGTVELTGLLPLPCAPGWWPGASEYESPRGG